MRGERCERECGRVMGGEVREVPGCQNVRASRAVVRPLTFIGGNMGNKWRFGLVLLKCSNYFEIILSH